MFKSFFLLSLSLYAVQAYVKFNNNQNETIKVPTFSFFQQQVAFFNVSGPVVELPINANPDGTNCTISYNLTIFDREMMANFTNPPHTITFIDYSGSPCFFDTFANTLKFFFEYKEYLGKLGYPNPDVLVLVRNKLEPGADVGFPFADYQGNTPTTIETPPPPWLKLQMVDSENATVTMGLVRDNINAVFEVTQENGPWNEAILSLWYRGTVWFLIIIMVIALIVSLYFVYVSYLDEVLTLNLKYLIYFLAFVDSILHTITMCVRYQTFGNVLNMTVHGLLISWAFHLLLYLWSMVMNKIQGFKFILAFRGVIVFSLTIYTMQKCFELVVLFKRVLNTGEAWKVISNYLFPGAQYLLSISFVFVAFFFYSKIKTLGGAGINNSSTADILKKLTIIAVTGFLCYFVLAFINSIYLPKYGNNGTLGVLGFLIYFIINVVRCIAILFIITLKESSLIRRERSWLESRLSFVEEKLSSLLGTRSNSTTSTLVSSSTSSGSVEKGGVSQGGGVSRSGGGGGGGKSSISDNSQKPLVSANGNK